MFFVSCFALAVFITICIVLWVKNERDFFTIMLIPTILTLSFVILLSPCNGTVIDVSKVLDSNNVVATEKDGKIEITPAFNYYILIETDGGDRFIIQVDDFNGKIGDKYTCSSWEKFNQ